MLGFGILLNRMKDKASNRPRSVLARVIFYFIAPVALLLTLSRTGILGFLSAYGTLLFLEQPFRQRTKRNGLFAFCLVLLMLYLVLPAEMLEGIVRRESWDTLQGRTGLWGLLLNSDSINLLRGAGYGAFWDVDSISYVEEVLGWAAPAAHNGFLDVLLNTGAIGLAFVLSLLVQFAVRVHRRAGPYRPYFYAFLVFLFVQNLTQGSFQNPRQFFEIAFWWLFLALGALGSIGKRASGVGPSTGSMTDVPLEVPQIRATRTLPT